MFLCLLTMPVQAVDVSDIPIQLKQKWRFQTGDDLQRARVDYDDSRWDEIEVPVAWGKQGYSSYGGYAWYRLKLKVQSKQPLALALGGIDWAAYEVYAGGELIGVSGHMPPDYSFSAPLSQVFEIGSQAISSDGTLTLAVRVWQIPESMVRTPQSGGFEKGVYLIGSPGAVKYEVEKSHHDIFKSELEYLISSVVFFLLSLYYLLFYRRRPTQKEYLWYSLCTLFFAINNYGSGSRMWASQVIEYNWLWKINSASLHFMAVCYVEFLWLLLARSVGRLLRLSQYMNFWIGVLILLLPGLWFSLVTSSPRALLALYVPVMMVYVVVDETRRGNPEARTIFWGMLVLVAVTFHDIAIRFGLIESVRLSVWGYGGLVLSMAISLTNRFARVYSELDELNRDLELKVQERTLEIEKQRDLIEARNVEILENLRYAETIQSTILPQSAQFDRAFREWFIIYRPRDIVSGDFYWLHDDGNVRILIVADCTGHGVAGAFMSMIADSLLDQIVLEQRNDDPAEILELLHLGLMRVLRQEGRESQDGLDIAICHIDRERVVFAGARRPLYFTDATGRFSELKGDRRSVGGRQRQHRPYTNHSIPFTPNLTIYLLSDGISDQPSEAGIRYGSRRLKALIASVAGQDLQSQQQLIERELQCYAGNAAQRDDITMVAVRL